MESWDAQSGPPDYWRIKSGCPYQNETQPNWFSPPSWFSPPQIPQLTPRQENALTGAQILSLVLTYMNLIENREQSAANDVNAANDKQMKKLLTQLDAKFENLETHLKTELADQLDQQNIMLRDIQLKLNTLVDVFDRVNK